MQAWVFRHLDELRPIYGVADAPAAASCTDPGQGLDPSLPPSVPPGLTLAPGTVARYPLGSTGDVVAAPMPSPVRSSHRSNGRGR
ncbi:MAG: hypothetical protein AAGB93_10260 [Planctomycetota bacterium]